jgi:hypothetical protein
MASRAWRPIHTTQVRAGWRLLCDSALLSASGLSVVLVERVVLVEGLCSIQVMHA